MKAYRCDMCGKYVDDVYSLSGISKPDRIVITVCKEVMTICMCRLEFKS